MAQGVFSVNAVGYVKLTIGSNNLALIANPLNQPNNDLNIILPLKDDTTQDGVSIYRFNPATGAYRSTISWISIGVGMGGVWFTPDSGTDPNATVLNPGEGVFFYNNTASSVDLTFVGEVMQGNLSSPIPANGALSIRSSQVPQSAALGDPSHADSLGFPAANGDLVYVFDVTAQTYKDTYTYIVDNTVVPPVAIWFSLSDLNPEGPVIPVGGSFFVIKADAAASVNWTRTFSVN
jgi:hypothetical protein